MLKKFLIISVLLLQVEVMACYHHLVVEQKKEENPQVLTNGNKPNLPSGRILGKSSKNARDAKKDQTTSPQTSGGFFDNISATGHFSLTSFTDGDFGSSGKVDERGLTLAGDLSESTRLTLGYTKIDYRYGKTQPAVRMEAHGLEAGVYHESGFGAYAFYQDIDIEHTGNSYAWGGGVNYTTTHDLGFANFTGVANLTYVDYDFDDDVILILLADLSRDITDWMAVGTNVTWTDSFTDNAKNADDNYWTLGADVRFNWNSFNLSIGWQKTYDYSDYKDNTLNISLTYTF